MPDVPMQEIDAALQNLQTLSRGTARPATRRGAQPKGAPAAARPRRFLRRLAAGTAGLVLMVVLPFFVLVRTAVYLYQAYGGVTWGAVAGGVLGATVVLLLCAALLRWKLGRRGLPSRRFTQGLLVLVCLYCGYTLLYISPANVKTPALRETYTSLHPLLRLSVSTLVLADGELVLTDTERQPRDYVRMGLSVRERSDHYRQPDGYAHAVDLRTRGRAAWENTLMQVYFEAMGLQTLRHVGTADHLHVALPYVD